MTDNFNYGHRMDFEKLHQHRFNDKVFSSDSMTSSASMQSSFGTHWKKVDSSIKGASIPSKTTTIPSKPTTLAPSLFSSYSTSSTIAPPMNSSASSAASNDSTATFNSNNTTSSLLEHTETREARQCLDLQMEGLDELKTTLNRCSEQFKDNYRRQKVEFDGMKEEEEVQWKTFEQFESCLDEEIQVGITGYERKVEKLCDTINQGLQAICVKEKIENFVREWEALHSSSNNMLRMISNDEERLAHICQILNLNRTKTASITTIEGGDSRSEQVYQSLVKMVRGLPLNDSEHANFNDVIQKIEQSQIGSKTKCEMIIQVLITTMGAWEKKSNSMSTFDSADWKSVVSVQSENNTSENGTIFGSSSFALTDPVNLDSNLSDLEGDLRSARIRKAVEGPKQIYELSPWSDASNFSQLSADSCSLSSIQSLGEPKSFTQSLRSTENLNTALSASSPVSPRPPRSVVDKTLVLQSGIGAGTYSDPYDFGNISHASLKDIIDQALHTAKDVESPSTHLLARLQNSEDGFDFKDLVTAISSSSECLSDTQSSHHSSIIH
ncbi:unnamed protein product [Caenorhabditis brenneri]